VQTSIVFFTKGKPTEHIWFYEVQPPVGRQKFSKTRQINADDLADCRKLIGDRAVGDHSWIMSVQELGSDVLLAQRKPQTKDAPDLPKSMGLGGHLAELSKVAEMIAPTVADLAEKAAQLSRSSFDLVAVSTPTKMASSRIAAAYTKRVFPECTVMPIDEDLANCSENLDLAALPATVAPQWAARVREAMSDTQRRLLSATWYGESPSQPVAESEKRKRGALQIISM
jgi:hypothetical protein